MLMPLRGDLRQMRHADDLTAFAERAQLPAHDFGDRAADAGVDLIEDHAARVARGARHLHGERQARELSARGNLGERPQRLPGIGGDAKFDLVDAVHGGLGLGQGVTST
jgi:hypothetical protein